MGGRAPDSESQDPGLAPPPPATIITPQVIRCPRLQNGIDGLLSATAKGSIEGKYYKRVQIIYNSWEMRHARAVKIAGEHKLFAHRDREGRQLVKQLCKNHSPLPQRRENNTHTHHYQHLSH